MNLLTKTAFAKWAGKSGAAVSKALKKGRLETFQDTGMINAGSPKSQEFAKTIGKGQKNLPVVPSGEIMQPDDSGDLTNVSIEVSKAHEKKLTEEAGFKEQQRIEKEMKNQYRRGQLVALKAIEETIMLFFDKQLNINKRYFSAGYDRIVRETLAKGEKVEGLKQEFLSEMEKSADEAKHEAMDKLIQIGKDQAAG